MHKTANIYYKLAYDIHYGFVAFIIYRKSMINLLYVL